MLNQKSNSKIYKKIALELEGNHEQQEVYNSSGNCVVLAGPGSGKTKILTLKLAKILNEDIESPQAIACLTYNNECVRELKERLAKLGVKENNSVLISTVHSFCLNQVIRPYKHLVETNLPNKIKVASSTQVDNFLLKSFNLTLGRKTQCTGAYKNSFNIYRRTILDRNLPEWKGNDQDIAVWIEDYERLLREENLIDFDDMALTGLNMIEQNEWIQKLIQAKFPVIVIDEYQDLGVSLDRIIRTLCFKNQIRLLAVGDPDQSIYGFTGAQPNLLVELSEKHEVAKIILKQNYRSKPNIVKASMAVISEERDFISNRTDGEGVINLHSISDGLKAQCYYICDVIIPKILEADPSNNLGEIGILYIDKNDGDIISSTLNEYGYQYIRVDGNAPYNKNILTLWIEDCAMWCSGGWQKGHPKLSEIVATFRKFYLNSSSTKREIEQSESILCKFLFRNRDIDLSLLKWLTSFHMEVISKFIDNFIEEPDVTTEYKKMFLSAQSGQLKDFCVSSLSHLLGGNDYLNLYTLHSSKGLEFKYVIIFGLEEGRIPWLNVNENKIKESRSLFYVGLTRSKDEIHLLYSGWYEDYNKRRREHGPSRFITELQDFIKKNENVK